MDLNIAESLVKNELSKHDLKGYSFEWLCSKRVNGQCFYVSKIIKLSKTYVELNNFNNVYDTILHEIAHALAWKKGNDDGHGQYWKAICKNIGCSGKRLRTGSIKAEYKHNYQCEKCKQNIGTYRKLKNIDNIFHKICGKEGKLKKID